MSTSQIGLKSSTGVYTIAEIGINHSGNLEKAKKLIREAAGAKANAVKFQTYLTEKRVKKDSPIFQLLKDHELPFKAFEALKSEAESCGVDFFSTPFDEESVAFLNGLHCRIHKIASFDVVNHQLLREVAKSGKTIIMSTGMATPREIDEALSILRPSTKAIALLHCVSAYPTPEESANLAALVQLGRAYPDLVIGQSDHTQDIFVPMLAVAAGARILEKHFMLEGDRECVDAGVSISPAMFAELVKQSARVVRIMGDGVIGSSQVQQPIEQYRRFSK